MAGFFVDSEQATSNPKHKIFTKDVNVKIKLKVLVRKKFCYMLYFKLRRQYAKS